MIYPEFPQEGSYVGICAPSAGVGSKLDSFDMSLEILEQTGLRPCETESVFELYQSTPRRHQDTWETKKTFWSFFCFP